MKRLISFLLTLCLLCSLAPMAFAAGDEAVSAANALHDLGLFQGVGTNQDGTPNYDLDRAPTRFEAVTMLVRLLGKEDEAKAGSWTTPFTDLADWAKPYVGYAYANKLTNGVSDKAFGGTATVTASQYLTFVLRALGYESGKDFQWDKAWELSDKLGFTKGQYNASSSFTRGDVAIVSNNALSVKLNGQDKTLKETLPAKPAASTPAAQPVPAAKPDPAAFDYLVERIKEKGELINGGDYSWLLVGTKEDDTGKETSTFYADYDPKNDTIIFNDLYVEWDSAARNKPVRDHYVAVIVPRSLKGPYQVVHVVTYNDGEYQLEYQGNIDPTLLGENTTSIPAEKTYSKGSPSSSMKLFTEQELTSRRAYCCYWAVQFGTQMGFWGSFGPESLGFTHFSDGGSANAGAKATGQSSSQGSGSQQATADPSAYIYTISQDFASVQNEYSWSCQEK